MNVKIVRIAFLLILIAPLLISAAPAAASGGKQIVLMLDSDTRRFVSVSIQGTNQKGKVVTWSKKSSAGFNVAYTKNYWWVEDVVRIDMVIEDKTTQQSFASTCLIDALYQPADSPRVEMVLTKWGCLGGEAGSTQDPIRKKLLPLHNALNTADYYLSDFDMDVFLSTLMLEAQASVCIAAVATAFNTGGLTLALLTTSITASCPKTAEKIITLIYPVMK